MIDKESPAWGSLIGKFSPDELADRLLRRIDLDSSGCLLPLEPAERTLLRRCFEEIVLGLAEPDQESPGSPAWLLAETVLEDEDRFAEAAAIYALAYDDLQAAAGDLARYESIVLRLKLAASLVLHAEEDREILASCVAFIQRGIALLEPLWTSQEIPRTAFQEMMFALQRWLGESLEELGQARAAEDAFCAASLAARTAEDRLGCAVRAAGVRAATGDLQGALRLLQSCESDLAEVPSGDARRAWEILSGKLALELGGRLSTLGGKLTTDWARELTTTMGDAFDHDEPLDPRRLRAMSALIDEIEREVPAEEDAALRHSALAMRALFAAAGDRHAEAFEILRQAESLEGRLAGDVARMQRLAIEARVRAGSGDAAGAVALFTALLPQIDRMADPSRRLELLGHYLACIAQEGSSSQLASVGDLVDRVVLALDELLRRQPGGAARRRARELRQREIEAAVGTLIRAAESLGAGSAQGQAMLARAWTLIMAVRNPELQARRSPGLSAQSDIRELEDAFHAGLREQFTIDPQARRLWQEPLEQLEGYEVSSVHEAQAGLNGGISLPGKGIAVATFQFRDLFSAKPLLVLGCREGRFRLHRMDQAERELTAPLLEWGERLRGTAGSRNATAEVEDPDARWDRGAARWVRSLFPGDWLDQEATGDGAAEIWSLSLDGELLALPIEMLPDPAVEGGALGQRIAVRHCLRPRGPEETAVELTRGWLGLGGAPAFAGLKALPDSAEEVASIARDLQAQGLPAEALCGEEAHAGRLSAHLEALRPAALHFATHGHGDPATPDSCALILAPEPGSPAGELLPFRKIRDLPLDGVQLVVLSACSSLIGPSGRAVGMEGLAWAFLRAGVAQVIASRYEVDDAATCRLMRILYRHLLAHPAAEALRRTRDEGLRTPGIGRREVGAWALWC